MFLGIREGQAPFTVTKVISDKPHSNKRLNIWTYKEMVKYAFFLDDHLRQNHHEHQQNLGREDFEVMSRTVESRNKNQCRIFHGKLLQIHR